MGYKGEKIGVYVLPERYTYQDTKNADGLVNFRMRLVKKAHKD